MAQGDMPYTVQKEGDQWCVYEKAGNKKVGDYPSRMAAMNKIRSLMKSGAADKENKAEDAAANEEQD